MPAATADARGGTPESTSWHARSLGISRMQPFVCGTALGAATRIKGLEAMLSEPFFVCYFLFLLLLLFF
jgi:hypothetical protein